MYLNKRACACMCVYMFVNLRTKKIISYSGDKRITDLKKAVKYINRPLEKSCYNIQKIKSRIFSNYRKWV
jgi:hypothetical protein